MRKLFLLIALALAFFYGSTLWAFTSEAESWRIIANYLPLGLMVIIFILGLMHIRFALGVSLILIMLFGNTPLINDLLTKVFHLPASWAIAGQFVNPIESIILGLFSAWIVIRFFGNPELDYEYGKAQTVRKLHFPVFVFGLAAFLAGIYAIIQSNNIFASPFLTSLKNYLTFPPESFFAGKGILSPVYSVIIILEGIAVYTIATNEIRTAKQARSFMWLFLVGSVIVAILGFLQYQFDLSYASRLIAYNKEIHSTFANPNTYAVFMMAMLPFCAAMIIRGKSSSIPGLIIGVIIIGAIILSETKLAMIVAAVFLVVVFIIVLARAVKQRAVLPLVLTAILLVAVIAGYAGAKIINNKDKEVKWAKSVIGKVDKTATAFFKGPWDGKALNKRTNYKFGDWMTALNMVKPTSESNYENTICGVGKDRFAANYAKYRSKYASRTRNQASNIFLQTFAEMGVFALLALVIIIVGAVSYSIKASAKLEYPLYVKAFAWSLIMIVIGCMTENAFTSPQIQVVFWMLAGLCMVFSSLTAKEQPANGGSFLKVLIVILILASWVFMVYKPILTQHENKILLNKLAEKYSKDYNINKDKLYASLEKTEDYNFHRKNGARWSDQNSVVMTKVTKPIFACVLRCVHPADKISEENPVNAKLSIDGEIIKNVVFTKPGIENVEVDISLIPKLAAYIENEQSVLLKIQVDNTWNPSEELKQCPDDNFDVGVGLFSISWKDELTPAPAPELKVIPAPEAPAPAAEKPAPETPAPATEKPAAKKQAPVVEKVIQKTEEVAEEVTK